MKITIASGKGGTGKTTVATHLAWIASQNGLTTAYLDCDTEAPNGHLFLKPSIQERREVTRPVPQVDSKFCIHCGQCSEICQFNAIVGLGQNSHPGGDSGHPGHCGGLFRREAGGGSRARPAALLTNS